MRFSLFDPATPSLDELAHRARAAGIACVDVAAEWLGDVERTRGLLGGLAVGCVVAEGQADAAALRRLVAQAADLGAESVRLPVPGVAKGRSVAAVRAEFAASVANLADEAAGRSLRLLVASEGAFATAASMWLLLELINHPAVGCSWELSAVEQAGERPAVAIPTLNSRIGRVVLPAVDPASDNPMIGSLRLSAQRLRGIGHAGLVSIELSGGPAEAATALVRVVEEWTSPPKKPAAKPKPAAAKG